MIPENNKTTIDDLVYDSHIGNKAEDFKNELSKKHAQRYLDIVLLVFVLSIAKKIICSYIV